MKILAFNTEYVGFAHIRIDIKYKRYAEPNADVCVDGI